MKILDKEIDFDLNDAENIDRLQELDTDYGKRMEGVTKLVDQCKIYKEFFDKALGDGTSEILFEGKNDYMKIVKAYNELIENIEKQLEEFMAESEKAKSKYERYIK